MTSIKPITILIILAAVALTTAFPTGKIFAQSTEGIIGELEISPFLLELQVEKGGTTQIEIEVTNRSVEPRTIIIQPKDFLPGRRGEPRFIPDDEINDPTFSLATWIDYPNDVVAFEPDETKVLQFSVNPPENAEQGTHYGAVLFNYRDADGSGVGVTQSVGTILLLEYGQARSNGESTLIASKRLAFDTSKVDFESYFNNIGNVHVKPKGEIYITNMFGRQVKTEFINKEAANVLPQSDRTFTARWFPGTLSFGRYKAESLIFYGRERLEARDVQIIWIFPWYFLVTLGGILLALVWFVLHGRHWHRRRVIEQHIKTKNTAP